MEAASLSNPKRRCSLVTPVQKSLSLPSYAKAGGDGIDHRLIFAAMEQREKGRRRSRPFAGRQTIFCLPIPSSGAKCKETSLSSDTSCSSLEYQKGKLAPTTTNSVNGHSPVRSSEERSSSDSLTRKERLVAIKARVEAEREKYGDTSSEDDRRNNNKESHRTVRDVKNKSSRKRPKRAKTNNKLEVSNNRLDLCPSPPTKNFIGCVIKQESGFVQSRIKSIEEEETKRCLEKPKAISPCPPTPPPRSPKCMSFVNRAIMQQHLRQEGGNSLERKKMFQANISAISRSNDVVKPEEERRKIRELLSSRRRTCSNFDFLTKDTMNEMDYNSRRRSFLLPTDNKGYFSEVPSDPLELKKHWWEEMKLKQEPKFNSLESKKLHSPSWKSGRNNEICLCSGITSNCFCKQESPTHNPSKWQHFKPTYSGRLSKSEVNITAAAEAKCLAQVEDLLNSIKPKNSEHLFSDEISKKASENLENAMQELESVYQSLKLSSDNLDDPPETNNHYLNDEGSKNSKKPPEPRPIDKHKEYLAESKNQKSSNHAKFDSGKDLANSNPFESIFSANMNALNSEDISKSLSIDELFNDLTRQLDIEQKLLKESREHMTKVECTQTKRPSPLESIVSIRKELYDNLHKNSLDQKKSIKVPIKFEDDKFQKQTQTPPAPQARKKYKAVRSLSANLSYLMDNSRPESRECDKPHHLILKQDNNAPCNKEENNSSKNTRDDTIQHEEIRHIRVSMDSIGPKSVPSPEPFPRLTDAVCKLQKSELDEFFDRSSSKDKGKMDETCLETLLNSLLGDVPETKQSSRFPTSGATSPPPSGKLEYVRSNRNLLSTKMDIHTSTKNVKESLNHESPNRGPEINAQKMNNDFCQNNNAHINKISYIPVYSKKNDLCHSNIREKKENDGKIDLSEISLAQTRNVLSTLSPPFRQKILSSQNERFPSRRHIRRHSVGFEDITSSTCCFGHTLTNDNRQQMVTNNHSFNKTYCSMHNNKHHSETEINVKPTNQDNSENMAAVNQNNQVPNSINENEKIILKDKPIQKLKDKSSKRKSSLNRMDFIQPSNSSTENLCCKPNKYEQRNSSSEELSDSKSSHKSIEHPLAVGRRKKLLPIAGRSTPERKSNQITLQNDPTSNRFRTMMYPQGIQNNHFRARHHRINQANALHLQKISHSAGELESHTDASSEVISASRICLSAQEFDAQEISRLNYGAKNIRSPKIAKKFSFSKDLNSFKPKKDISICHDASQNFQDKESPVISSNNEEMLTSPDAQNLHRPKVAFSGYDNVPSSTIDKLNLESSVSLAIVDSGRKDIVKQKSEEKIANIICSNGEEDAVLSESINQMENLEIIVSDKENGGEDHDSESESEKRPNSILRKSCFEERKELHSILKPTLDDKMSKTPSSILKHRESSEEKETWQQSDLHSILKKSTSEDESGPDIRPILKNASTDDESPGSTPKPRPILKKRTSFGDERTFALFHSGELKPILKKKTPLPSEDQPKPILKSRRKSEDVRSAIIEPVSGRPRAYSADAGIHRADESCLHKSDYHDL